MSERYDWDALAPYWHLFEARGSDARVIAAANADGLQAPILYVGAGLGTYAIEVARSHTPVIALDRSPAMARLAHVRHPRLLLTVGDVLALPFRDAAFRGVICATGVFELLGDQRTAAFRELHRVARGAPIHVATFIDSGTPIDRHAMVEAWLGGHAKDALLDRLAQEVGDRERAARLVENAMPRFDVSVTERQLIDAAAAAGLSTRRLFADRERGVMLCRHE
jgi:ubiquinone/menaquinone biosynthesis C-methylase UbiE